MKNFKLTQNGLIDAFELVMWMALLFGSAFLAITEFNALHNGWGIGWLLVFFTLGWAFNEKKG